MKMHTGVTLLYKPLYFPSITARIYYTAKLKAIAMASVALIGR